MNKIYKKSIAVIIALVMVAQGTMAFALTETEVRTRISGIIGELSRVFAGLSSGEYCTGYDGSTDIADIQKALNTAGFDAGSVDGKMGSQTTAAVTAFQTAKGLKVDGKAGPQTRAALVLAAPHCPDLDLIVGGESIFAPLDNTESSTESTNVDTDTSESLETSEETDSSPTEDQSTTETESDTLSQESVSVLGNGDITTAVRSTNSALPDNTAVFTFRLSMENDVVAYVPVNPADAFDIKIENTSGAIVSTQGVDSLVSSGSIVTGQDGVAYYVVSKDDTLSLRKTIQPGAGSYYARLARLSYTNDNVAQVSSVNYVQYGFDSEEWTSETVVLKN